MSTTPFSSVLLAGLMLSVGATHATAQNRGGTEFTGTLRGAGNCPEPTMKFEAHRNGDEVNGAFNDKGKFKGELTNGALTATVAKFTISVKAMSDTVMVVQMTSPSARGRGAGCDYAGQLTASAPAAAVAPANGLQLDIAAFDVDHDGSVTSAEFIAGRHKTFEAQSRQTQGVIPAAAVLAGFPAQMPAPLKQAILRKIDADQDGKVTAAEFDEQSRFMFANLDEQGAGRLPATTPVSLTSKTFLGPDFTPNGGGGQVGQRQASQQNGK